MCKLIFIISVDLHNHCNVLILNSKLWNKTKSDATIELEETMNSTKPLQENLASMDFLVRMLYTSQFVLYVPMW